MSEAPYTPPGEREKPDPERRRYFEEYMARPEIGLLGVTYGRYCEVREAGRWNEYCDRHLGGRFKLTNEREGDGGTVEEGSHGGG